MIIYEVGLKLDLRPDHSVTVPGNWFTDREEADSFLAELQEKLSSLVQEPLGDSGWTGRDLLQMVGATGISPYMQPMEAQDSSRIVVPH